MVGVSCQVSGRLPCRISSRTCSCSCSCVLPLRTALGGGLLFVRLPSPRGGRGRVLMGAAAANAGATPESCGGRRPGAGAMGGYELVRSDDAAAVAVDLEAGTTAACGRDYPKRHGSTPSSPAPATASTRLQRLVSLDVFRGITVLVRTIPPSPSSARSLAPSSYLID